MATHSVLALENSMDREFHVYWNSWCTTVHGVSKSQVLKNRATNAFTFKVFPRGEPYGDIIPGIMREHKQSLRK